MPWSNDAEKRLLMSERLEFTTLAMSFCVSPRPASLRTSSGSIFFLGLAIVEDFLDFSLDTRQRCLPRQVRQSAVVRGAPVVSVLARFEVHLFPERATSKESNSRKPSTSSQN